MHSESTPPTFTKRASQFRRPLLRRKGARLNITSPPSSPTRAAGLPPILWQQSGEGDMEEKGSVLPELPPLERFGRTGRQLRRGELGGSPAAQLREYNPFSSMSRFNMDFRESRPKILSPNSSQPRPR